MNKFEVMVPFILNVEAGVPSKYLSMEPRALFEVARKTGYSNHPNDKGGATLCGVTLATYRQWRKAHGFPVTTVADLRAMPYEHWAAILKSLYWDKWRADEIKTTMVAVALVDWVWGSGKHGITRPQKLLGVKADGVVGPKTIAAVNGYADQKELFDKIQGARNAFHASIAKPGTKNAVFLKGWNNRVRKITWDGFKL